MEQPQCLFLIIGGIAVCALSTHGTAGDPQFSERAVAAGIDVIHDTSGFVNASYTAGGAVGDFNNDGWQDLFVISGGDGNVPDHLFINNHDGTFTDEAATWGLIDVHKGKGASVGDYNGDGWLDLYVTSAGTAGNVGPGFHRLYRNNGGRSFTNVAVQAGVNFTSLNSEDGYGSTFGDYDLDGDLDLFVAGFANGNLGSRLFQNNGDGTFSDITDAIGLYDSTPISVKAFAPRLIDMDGDWYPDLLLVGDFGTSRYFRNNTDGTFTDITAAAGVSQEENGMGQSVGDINGDGLVDWYVASIYFPGIGWTGNKLYLNNGNHSYTEVAQSVGVFDGGYGWGSIMVDFNHDGRLDIAETNGDDSNFGGAFTNEQSYLWIQGNDGNFVEVALASGLVHTGKGRGMVNFDYDNDGDQDVVIFAHDEVLSLYENEISGPDVHWLRVFLDSSAEPLIAPNGHGARVSVTIDGETQVRVITSGDNFESHSELSAHFGIGSATNIDELRVDWPNGMSTTQTDVPANQTVTIAYGDDVVGDLDDDGAVGITDLLILLANWGPCADCNDCAADLNGDCNVGIADLLILLANWG